MDAISADTAALDEAIPSFDGRRLIVASDISLNKKGRVRRQVTRHRFRATRSDVLDYLRGSRERIDRFVRQNPEVSPGTAAHLVDIEGLGSVTLSAGGHAVFAGRGQSIAPRPKTRRGNGATGAAPPLTGGLGDSFPNVRGACAPVAPADAPQVAR